MSVTSLFRKSALEAFISSAAYVRLYISSSDPDEDGTGFVEAPNGNGYESGGYELAEDGSDWSLQEVDGVWRATLISDHYWTATGGSISNIAGLYVVNEDDNVLSWWERDSPITINPEDVIRISGVYVSSDTC